MGKTTRATVPAHWQVAEVARVRGNVLTPGRELRIHGQRGTFRFLRHVANTHTGTEWLDVRDANGAMRAFRAEQVRSVSRTRKLRPARNERAAVAA